MRDQDSNPKQTGRTPRCPKCKCISINIRNTHVDDPPEHTTGICYRFGCGYEGPISQFLAINPLAEENAQLRKALEDIANCSRMVEKETIIDWAKAALEQK